MAPSNELRVAAITPAELIELFGGPISTAAGDQAFMEEFMQTFSPRPGDPSSSHFETVPVPLTLTVNIVVFDGIPSKNQQATHQQRTIPFTKTLKFPIGALQKVRTETAFGAKVASYVYEGHKVEAVEAGTKKCNCCGNYADGFVTAMTLDFPTENTVQAVLEGFSIVVETALPACKQTDCNRRLRKFMSKQQQQNDIPRESSRNVVIMCANDQCRKVQGPNESFSKCARCRIRFYCSKECQIADWVRFE